jgi:hypothetical protein
VGRGLHATHYTLHAINYMPGNNMKFKYNPSLKQQVFLMAAGEFFQHIFVVLLVTYLLLLLTETAWEESATSVFNTNYLLIGVIIAGIPAVLTSRIKPDEQSGGPVRFWGILMSACAGIAGAVLVWYKTRDIGWPSIVMSIVSCVLILSLSLLIMKDDDAGEEGDEEEDSEYY